MKKEENGEAAMGLASSAPALRPAPPDAKRVV
jgi:hypothetical protein